VIKSFSRTRGSKGKEQSLRGKGGGCHELCSTVLCAPRVDDKERRRGKEGGREGERLNGEEEGSRGSKGGTHAHGWDIHHRNGLPLRLGGQASRRL